jgi:sulfatase maturation enzyme AslB (radical SAM superfamily)
MKANPEFISHKQKTVSSINDFLNGKERHPRFPLEIFLEISNVCNLKCAMCSVFSELNPYRLVALKAEDRGFLCKDYIEALSPLLTHALLVHCYGYGEPTIHPKFVEIMDLILKHEVLVDFFTNGMNLTEELCEFLVDRKVFRVTVSFSGSTEEDYENIYLNGRYQTVLDGIERLHRIKIARNSPYPEVDINSIAFQHHMDHIVEFVDLMSERGVNSISLKPLHAYGSLPMLHSHIAVMRPWVEGELLKKAKQLALKKGVALIDEFSNVATVSSPEEEKAVRQRLIWGATHQSASVTPLNDFKKLAKTIKPIIPAQQASAGRPKSATAMDHSPDTIDSFLDLRAPEFPPETMCSQPFQTLYVNQQGAVRPCCFGFSSTYLGSLETHGGEDIWNGIGYSTAREAVLEGKYPMRICKACLQQKSYPKKDAFLATVLAYSSWFKDAFQEDFKSDLTYYAQIFVDTGNDFNEGESIIKRIAIGKDEQNIEFDLGSFNEIKRLRFDPANSSVAVVIHDSAAIDMEGARHRVYFESSNAIEQRDNILLFLSDDPQVILSGPPPGKYRKILFSISYFLKPLDS